MTALQGAARHARCLLKRMSSVSPGVRDNVTSAVGTNMGKPALGIGMSEARDVREGWCVVLKGDEGSLLLCTGHNGPLVRCQRHTLMRLESS